MPPISLARRPAISSSALAARAGLVLLVALAGLLVAGRLQVPPAVRTVTVGRAPVAVAVDARTRHVFVANFGSNMVSMLDAGSGAVLATTRLRRMLWPERSDSNSRRYVMLRRPASL